MGTCSPTDKLTIRTLGRETEDPGMVFGVRARTRAENAELRKLLLTTFVDRSKLDKLLVQSGLIAQNALMRAAYSISGCGWPGAWQDR